jgi:hypothetical protein
MHVTGSTHPDRREIGQRAVTRTRPGIASGSKILKRPSSRAHAAAFHRRVELSKLDELEEDFPEAILNGDVAVGASGMRPCSD